MRPSRLLAPLTGLLALGAALPAGAQSIDPRSFVDTPVGINFLVAGFGYSWGNVAFDPSVPIKDADLKTGGPLLGYARAMNFWGLSGKVNAGGAFACADGTGEVQGQVETRKVCGLSDLSTVISVNFIGAPALSLGEYPHYKQGFLMGASIATTIPVGQYDPDRLVNIGTHRWSFRPQIGLSQAMGRLTLEFLGSVVLYTRNGDFYHGHTRDQAPLYSGQLNVIYTFRSGIWGSLGATAYGGGRITSDGKPEQEIQENWRLGATLVFPVNRRNSIKAWGSTGLYARTGGDFNLLGASWIYAFGGRKKPIHAASPPAPQSAP